MSEAHAQSILSTLLKVRQPSAKKPEAEAPATKTYTATRRLKRKPENKDG